MANDGSNKYGEDYLLRKEGRSKVSSLGNVFFIFCVIVRENRSMTSDHIHCGLQESRL